MKKILSIALLLLILACSKDAIIGDSQAYEDIPSGLSARGSIADTSVVLQWNSVSKAAHYRIIRREDLIVGDGQHFTAAEPEWIDTTIALGVRYYYAVQSNFGSSTDTSAFSQFVSVMVEPEEGSDSGEVTLPSHLVLNASDGTENAISLAWTPCANEVRFLVERASLTDSVYMVLADSAQGATFVDETTEAGGYSYRVTAFLAGDSLSAVDAGHRTITPHEFFLEVNKEYKSSQAKIGRLNNKELGTESAGGAAHGTLTYDSYLDGFKAAIATLTYDNYRDGYLTLNGTQRTTIDGLFSQNGSVGDTVFVRGLYNGFVDHHITVSGGDPSGGHYRVGLEGVDTVDVLFATVKDAVLK